MAKKRITRKTSQKVEHPRLTPPDSVADLPLPFPIVGIGASAGGLEAFEIFFAHLPPESGMAFVVVQHLDPAHKSILSDLLKKHTSMPVVQVEDGISVEPNTVYVIPPNSELALQDHTLRLTKPSRKRGLRLPIDVFFRSLAEQQKDHSICIILSGTGTDGTLGMKAVKEAGGLAIIQTPESARYNGMPTSAVNTGLADVILPVDQIAAQLIRYVQLYFGKKLFATQNDKSEIIGQLHRIFALLRENTGHDFSGYKENTILRRIERRMAVNQLIETTEYLNLLENSPQEVQTLFHELMIGVTKLFRDPEAFEQLRRRVIIPILSQPGAAPQIRIWIPGCSTGEEALSVAILFHEQMERLGRYLDVQIFATDIDQAAIEKAREASYPESIVADISAERLQKYFMKDDRDNHYRVRREIREMVIFAVQDAIKDPPFSRLDLICCRNLMIYLGTDLQQRLLSIFHYALNPRAFLFLGNSENLGNAQKHFITLDQKWKIFQKSNIPMDMKTVLEFPYTHTAVSGESQPVSQVDRQRVSIKELTESLLLSEYTPTCVVINDKGDVFYVHGRTGKYLEQTTGEISTNILKMARQGLRMALNTAIRKAGSEQAPYTTEELRVDGSDSEVHVKVTVSPIPQTAGLQGLLLVLFDEVPLPISKGDHAKDKIDDRQTRRILELEDELRATHEYLQTTVEELETTNEELKSAVEELQSSNEELQSANEELQTSKEELQSINEELVTVNAELQASIEELTRANTDIKNLLDNIQVGVLFLDMNLRIRRFTPSAVEIVDLIPADIGRPLAQFAHKLQHNRLIQEARETLDTLEPREFEVRSRDGNWYLMRILPYYTLDQQVDGVVLTITDITELKNAEKRLRESETLFRTLAENYPNVYLSIIEQDMTVGFSAGLEFKKQNLDPEQYRGLTLEQVFGNQAEVVRAHYQQAFAGIPQEFELIINGQYQLYRVVPLPTGDHTIPRILSVVENITERRHAEKALADSLNQYRLLVEASHDGIIHNDVEGNIISINSKFAELFGFESVNEIMEGGVTTFDLLAPEEKDSAQDRAAPVFESDQVRNVEMKVKRKDGSRFEAEFNTTLIRDDEGQPARMVTYVRDITERKRAAAERQHLLNVLEVSLNELYMFDPETLQFQYVNEGASRNLGYSLEQLKTKTPNDLQPEFTEASFRKLIEPMLQHEQEKLLFQTVHRRSDGSLYPVDVHLQLVENPHRRVFLAVILDITERKQAEEALRESEEKARMLLNAIPDLLFRLNREGVFLDYKADQTDLYTQSTDIVGKKNRDLAPLEFADLIDQKIRATLDTGEMQAFEYQLPIPERGLRNYEARMFPSGTDEVTAIVRDVTEQKQAAEALRQSQQLLHDIVNNTPALIYMADTHDHFMLINSETEKLLGIRSSQIIGKTRLEVLPEALAVQHRNNDLEVIRSESPQTFVEESPETNGLHYYLTTKFPLFDANHEVYAVCGISVDITERKKSEEQLLMTTQQLSLRLAEIEQLQNKLQEQAIRDPLTGLYNRRYMSETLEREIARAGREHTHLSVIVSDIDKFKAINDTHGHKLGDEFLVQIGAILKKHIRGSDVVCRYGGEEFVLILPNTKFDSAIHRAEQIRQKCQDFGIRHEGHELSVTISFGVVTYPLHGAEAEELIIKADKAMYRSKEKGGNLVQTWDDVPDNK